MYALPVDIVDSKLFPLDWSIIGYTCHVAKVVMVKNVQEVHFIWDIHAVDGRPYGLVVFL